jgi:RNA polymerase sigma factor (sigma-70 family)
LGRYSYNGRQTGATAEGGHGWETMMDAVRPAPIDLATSDEELMRLLAAGHQEALGPLYSRYAPLIFNLAAQSLDRAGAEEIVQEVFLAVWRTAATFDPAVGPFRPWILQIAHFRILNELRRRNRRPRVERDADGERLAALPDPDPEPADAAWQEYRRAAVRAALEKLPPPQRQALGLAFFEDLTHEQVAATLEVPLGTAKTRIRAGLQKLQAHLAPLVLALAVGGSLVALGIRYQAEQAALQRTDRALRLVVASDVVPIRLVAAPGVPEATHGTYRGRPGTELAVMSLSKFEPAPAGQVYQAWGRYGGTWRSLGTARPDAGTERTLLIVEGAWVAHLPEAVQVTLEPAPGSLAPTGPLMASGAR